ncbi:DUF2332 domain-containing protein [Cryptosporangium arvum]|uniref:DUF2332 domain-containing protein n=1 Tax=Cryptosporangium arvum TaxID=80871 RepID=UPI0004B9122D|nr:DUF2332 domain-containing protein [Cryptosporangium arvum]
MSFDLPPFPAPGDLPGHLRWQAAGCGDRAPLSRALLRAAADDAESGGPTAALLAPYVDRPAADAPGLRFLAAAHYLVLNGSLPELARFYPSAGGTEPFDGAWEPLHKALIERPDEFAARLTAPVQTNETGRAAALYGGLAVLTHHTGLPIRLLEIGASAGLNLRADRFGYRVDGTVYGGQDSPLILDEPFRGIPPVPLGTRVSVVERRGCDPHPLDPADAEHRRRLESLVWAEQVNRLERLRAAIAVAGRVPAEVDRTADTAGWLADRLAEASPGTVTLVWHSVVQSYVDHDAWRAIEALLDEVGEHTGGDAPLARLAFEPETDEDGRGRFAARLTLWPDGTSHLLGTTNGHGIPFAWAG